MQAVHAHETPHKRMKGVGQTSVEVVGEADALAFARLRNGFVVGEPYQLGVGGQDVSVAQGVQLRHPGIGRAP